ncbi:MAG: tetratricopeptide repeat protein [Myxococcales bacterium]|nr:tetratricopeptide repeat protein [Myxococcales bacterium]
MTAVVVSEYETRSIDHPGRRPRALGMATVALLAVCLALACGPSSDEAQRHLERARAAREEGAHAAAVIEYRSVLQSAPSHPQAHYELALSLLELGRGSDALWELRESFRLDPDNLDARLRFAWLALAGQIPDEALEQAAAILARDPSHREGRNVHVAALLAQGELERAVEESEALRALWPEEKRAYYYLAHARVGQGRLAEAERNLLRFRELDGRSLASTREVMRFYLATGQPGKAENLLKEAIPDAAAADRAELALALAELVGRDGRLAESEGSLRLTLAGAPERLDVREQLAALLAGDGRVDEALELLEKAKALSPNDAEVHRAQGDLLIGAGRFAEALAGFRAGLELAPGSGPLRLREAEALLRLGDVESSSERIRRLLEEHPEDPLVALTQVRALALASRTEQAIETLRGLLAKNPELAPAQFLLGVLHLASGRPGEAVRPLEIAADRMTGDAAREVRRLLVEARIRVGEFEAAVSEAEQILAEKPGDGRARVLLGHALLGAGSPERAESVLREAPDDSAAVHAALARVYVKTKRLEQAQASMERARALEPDSVQWVVDLAWVLAERGAADEAIARARESMLEHPDEPEYPNLLGRILADQGDDAAARTAFRRALEVDPEFAPALMNLAAIARRERRPAEARELLRSALAQRPGDAEALRALGLLEYREGNAASAIEAFEAALRADPGDEPTRSNLARARADAGYGLAEALEFARAARQSEPENPGYADTLGLVLYRNGLYRAAAEQFRAAIALAPHAIASFHYRLGLALLAGGDGPGARIELERALELDPSFAEAEDARRLLSELSAGSAVARPTS